MAPGRPKRWCERARRAADRTLWGVGDFDREAAERILRRAIELGEPDASSRPDGVSERALVEAAEELGLDPAVVRLAAGEERLGLLRQQHQRGDKLVGPGVVVVTRTVESPATELMERTDAWLRRHGSLRRARLGVDPLVAEYTRRSDAAAGIQRTIRSFTGQESLGELRRLRVLIHPLEERRSILALGADLQTERQLALYGGSSVAGAGATLSVVQTFAMSPWWWAGVPASVAGGYGIMRWRASKVPDVEVALNGVADRVAAGDMPTGVIEDVRDRLLGGLMRPQRRASD